MKHLRRLSVVCLGVALVFVAWGRMGHAADLNFRETELPQIMAFIAKLGNINIIVDPKIRQKMSFQVQNVEPEEAMYLLAKLANLDVKRVQEVKGKPTYVVATSDIINTKFEPAFNRTRRLRYAKADEVALIITKSLGKGFDVGIEKDIRTNSLILRGPEQVLDKIEDLVKELDLPVPQVLIDAKIVSVQTALTKNLGFDWNWGTGKSADGVVSDQTAGSGPLFAITEFQKAQNNSTFFDSPNAAKGSSFLNFGDFFRSNYFFNAAFTALETNGITRTLSSPRLLAINGTQAQLRIGDKIVFSGGPSQPPEERDTGTVMDITPRINKDNFITMDINVEQSSARFDRGDFPTITRTNTKTTVQVHDGEEVLVGGLVQESSTPNTVKVPFLADIPIIKEFFTKKNNSNTSLELVILMTPRIIKQQVAEASGEVSPAAGAPPPEVQDIFEGGRSPGTPPDAGRSPRPVQSPGPSGAPPAIPGASASPGAPPMEFPELE